jgi:hypothetical protein
MFFPAVMACGMALSTIHPAHAGAYQDRVDEAKHQNFVDQYYACGVGHCTPAESDKFNRIDETLDLLKQVQPDDNN